MILESGFQNQLGSTPSFSLALQNLSLCVITRERFVEISSEGVRSWAFLSLLPKFHCLLLYCSEFICLPALIL